MLTKDTEELKKELIATDNINNFLSDNSANFRCYTFTEYFNLLLREKSLLRRQVIKASSLGTYAYHILAGTKKSTSRKNILSIAFAMGLSPKETDYLLYYAGHKKLYPRSKWDSVVFYALYKHKNIEETNKLLANCNLTPLLGDVD